MDLFTYLMAKKGHNTHRDLFSYLLGSGNKLPSEYQRLEYIESTGTQYINTGRKPSDNEDVKIKCFITSTTDGHPVYGAWSRSTTSRRHIWSDPSTTSKIDLGWGTAGLSPVNVNYSSILNISAHFQAGNQKLTVNGLSNNSSSNANTNPNLTAYLFARHNSDGAEFGILMRLYSCKIYDNGVLVRNFIPCMRKTDNEVGLYDAVGEQFYTNAGTGKFAYKGYTFVEYIESTGTQYINSNVNADDINYSFDIDFYGYSSQIQYPRIFGYQRNGGIILGSKFWYGNNTDINCTDILGTFNDERHSVFANKNYAIVDNVKYNLNTPPTSFIKNTFTKMAVFGSFDGGTGAIRNDSFSKIKLYNFKIYHNNNLIRNFIPAIRNSDNVAGLYDLANDTFYTNTGTGTFVTPTSQLSGTQSLNNSLLSNNIQEETNIDDIQEETNLDDVNEIEEQNDEPIENEEIIEEEVS